MKKLNNDIINLQKGLQPDHLSFWYQKIILDTKEMAPPWLQDKIKVNQDESLEYSGTAVDGVNLFQGELVKKNKLKDFKVKIKKAKEKSKG